MPDAKPSESESDYGGPSAEELSGDLLDTEALKARGDIAGLLDLARSYRSGSAPGGRDMKRCFDAYCAAAELGSADAEYAVALFWMAGGVVEQDLKEGSIRLRSAAEKGCVPAKVYVGNLYELGIYYKADQEKADVWYKSAARGARITSEPGSEEHARELAEIGCVRHVLTLVARKDIDEAFKTRLLQRARAHGYGLREKDATALTDGSSTASDETTDRATFLDSLQKADTGATAAASTAAGRDTPEPKAEGTRADRAPAAGPSRTAIAFGAFGYALLFAVAGVGAAYAAMLGARELVTRGTALPWLGTRADLVFPIVLGLVGIVPSWLAYRFGTLLKALLAGCLLGGIGWIAWGTGQAALHSVREVQATAFGLSGFLAALLVLGLLGGTKRQPPRR